LILSHAVRVVGVEGLFRTEPQRQESRLLFRKAALQGACALLGDVLPKVVYFLDWRRLFLLLLFLCFLLFLYPFLCLRLLPRITKAQTAQEI
jgi:hypothetical protein